MDNAVFDRNDHQSSDSDLSIIRKDSESDPGNKNHVTKIQLSASPSRATEGTVQMKRQITLLGGVAIIIGAMIGTGIFIFPGTLLKRTDSVAWSLIIWTLCGVLTMLTSLSYMELGSIVPKSGGEHAYFQAAYGPLHKYLGNLPAFLFSWVIVLLLCPSGQAVSCLSFAKYALEIVIKYSHIEPSWEDSANFELTKKILATTVTWALAVLNIMYVKFAERAQIGFTACKISAMVIVIGVGIYNVSAHGLGSIPTKFDNGNARISDFAIAAYSGLWAYAGWSRLNYLTEELINPRRNLPLAILIAVPTVMVLYILINLAYLTVLTKDELIEANAVAVKVGDSALGSMSFIIPVLIAISAVGTANGEQFGAGRIGYVAGREGHLPAIISYVHIKYLSPTVAIILNTVGATIFIFASSVNAIVEFFGILDWTFYALAIAAVILLRFTQPKASRKFKVPLVIPIIALLVAIFLVVAPVVEQPGYGYLCVLVFLLVGVVLYTHFVYKGNALSCTGVVTKGIQRLFIVAPSPYLGEDEEMT